MKKRFFGTRLKLIAICAAVIILLEAVALPLGFTLLTNSELDGERIQKEKALTSLSTSFSEEVVGSLLEYDYMVFETLYDEYKDKVLTPNSEISTKYFQDYEEAKELIPFIGMTQVGTYRNLVMSALRTTIVPSTSSYLYLCVYNPATNIALVSMGACVKGDNIFLESVKEGYYFKYEYPLGEGFEVYNHKFYSPFKGEMFANVHELDYKDDTIVSDDSLRYLVISEVHTSLVYENVNATVLKYFILTLLTGVLMLTLFILLIHFFFLKKVKMLSALSSKKKEEMKEERFEKVFSPSKNVVYDEFDELNDDLYYLEDELHNYVAKFKENLIISEKMRIEDELSSKIQLSSLPSKIVKDEHISISPSIKTAKAVGGDLYDYFYIDNNRFAFFIGDVSGKGVPAALFMMKAKTLIKYSLMSYTSLLDAVKYVNEQLLIDNEASLFITAFIGVVDIKNNTLTFVNAGHEKPFINNDGSYKVLSTKSNLPLGVYEYDFIQEKIVLKENDTLVMYTDGVSEAKDKEDNLFGLDRIKDVINEHRFDPLFVLNKKILMEVEKFAKGHEQDDDICLLSFKYKPSIMTILNKIEEMDKLNTFISTHTAFISDKKTMSEINIIVDEIVSNIVHYAYDKEGDIDIILVNDDINKELYLHFLDKGKPFNPFTYENNRKEDDIGGLGISLVTSFSTHYEYNQFSGYNCVTIKKKY